MIIAHKIALDPNKKQAEHFAQACGVARFAWNWALAEWQRQYQARKDDPNLQAPSAVALQRQMNAIKREQFPWMADVTTTAQKYPIINLGEAFKRFFTGKSKYPQFKKKGVHDSFRADNGMGMSVDGRKIRLPKIGWVRMRQELRFNGKIVSAVVSRTADRWFVSITVEIDHQVPHRENQAVVGVDLGVKTLATMSDGSICVGPKALSYYLAKLKRLSRAMSRKKKGSANRRKAQMKLARLHARISNIRNDVLHKLTTYLTQTFTTIVIEDLNVKGMAKNRHLARAISDVGMGEFRRQLEYKAPMRGAQVILTDRWFASSKTCSICGHHYKELTLREREWTCPDCGTVHDRDFNAARNLAKLAVSPTVAACGEESSDDRPAPGVKLASLKQEHLARACG